MSSVFDEGFVEAYAKSTGTKQVIPQHWLDDPVLGKNFSLTPSAKAREVVADQPSESWTHKQLDKYAADNDLALGDARTVAEKVAAIAAAEEARIPRGPDGEPLAEIDPDNPDGAGPGDDHTDPA
jgi:hypothetical protein